MNSTLTRALCSLMVCLTFGLPRCFAQAGGPPGDVSPGHVFLQPGPGPADDGVGYAIGSPFGPWVGLDARFGDGIGWEGGYYGASAFIPRHFDPGVTMMYSLVNLSLTGDNSFGNYNGRGVLNVGSGFRYRNPTLNRIFGFAGFFDLDDGHNETYKRVGVSFESLGKYLDLRANTYLVIGDDRNKISDVFVGDPFFQQNFLMLTRRQVYENAYGGADAEIGGLLPYVGRYGLSGFVGAYWLHHEDEGDKIGSKIRFEAQVNEDFTVGVQHSHDDLFGSNTYASLSFTLPDGKPSRWFRPRPVKERMALPVVREQRIAVHNKIDYSIEPLINPADGQAMRFQFVNDLAAAGGTGTFENPTTFANLVNTAATDVILVSGANPQSRGTTLALFDNQRLLGTGITHTVTGLQGTFVIPNTGTGINPTISNFNNLDIVQLANNNEVAGLTFTGNQIGNGIVTPAGGVVGLSLHDNRFQNLQNGVFLTNATGTLNVQTNTFTNNLGPAAIDGTGFRLDVNNGGTSNLTFANNSATANRTGFQANATGGSIINITATGNTFDDNTAPNTGFDVSATGAGSAINLLNFQNNSVRNNLNGNGMRFEADAGGTITISNFQSNVISGNGQNGIYIDADGAGTTITANIGVAGGVINQITGNGVLGANAGVDRNGINILSSNAAVVQGSILNNQINTQANGRGIFMQATNGTLDFGDGINAFNGSIATNQINGNGLGGIQVNGNGGATDLRILSNAIGTVAAPNLGVGIGVTMTGAHQLNFFAGGDPFAAVSQANIITAPRDAGIAVSVFGTQLGGTEDLVRIQGNSITGVVDLAGTTGSSNPQGDGIYLQRRDDTILTAVVGNDIGQVNRGNTITSAVNGMRVFGAGNFPIGGGLVSTVRFDGNTFSTLTNDGVNFDLQGDMAMVATGISNIITGVTNEGIQVTTANNASFGDPRLAFGTQSQFLGNIINKTGLNTGTGIALTANNNSLQNVFIGSNPLTGQRTTITGGANGITFAAASTANNVGTNPQRNTLNVQATDINNVNADGVNLAMSGSGGSVVNIGAAGAGNNVTILNSGDDGIDATSSGGNNTLTVTNVQIQGSGRVTGGGNTDATRGDGLFIGQTGGDFTFNLFGTSSTFSAGRGLTIDVNTSNRPGLPFVFGTSQFNIGGFGANQGNILSNNGLQNIYYSARATVDGSSTVVAVNILPPGPARDELVANQATFVTLRSEINVLNNQIQFSQNQDGFVLAPGSNSLVVANVSGNTISGNAGNDFVVAPILSINPANSTNDPNPANNDTFVRDPVALLDLLFGAQNVGGTAAIDGNIGNTVALTEVGTGTAFAGTTVAGLYTNADVYKGANRSVNGRFQVRVVNSDQVTTGVLGLPGTAGGNLFTNLGVNLNVVDSFSNAGFDILAPATVFPDPTFP